MLSPGRRPRSQQNWKQAEGRPMVKVEAHNFDSVPQLNEEIREKKAMSVGCPCQGVKARNCQYSTQDNTKAANGGTPVSRHVRMFPMPRGL